MVKTELLIAFHQCCPGLNPGADMRDEFVIGYLPCFERFFSMYSGFPSPQKPPLPNSNSIWNAGTHLNMFSRTLRSFIDKQITVMLPITSNIWL